MPSWSSEIVTSISSNALTVSDLGCSAALLAFTVIDEPAIKARKFLREGCGSEDKSIGNSYGKIMANRFVRS
jgi:hypothetical protein